MAAPPVGATWQIQYSGTLRLGGAAVVNLDGEDTPTGVVTRAKDRGAYAICYINAGAWEDWRSDADAYPSELQGKAMDGWPGERWVDIRDHETLMPLLERRLDTCARKGFDAVDPDNVDGWTHDTGFGLRRSDSIALIKALSQAAHERGLAIGLKNATEILSDVDNRVEFAVNEECVRYDECGVYRGFLASGKAVFHVEYSGSRATICAARPVGMSTVIKDTDLGPGGSACP